MKPETKGRQKAVRPEKEAAVKQLNDAFGKAQVAVLAEFRGMTVDKVTELRANLRKGKAKMQVVKNTLAKRALKGTKYEGLKDKFKGPVVVAWSDSDVITPAKLLEEYTKANEKGLTILGGSMGDKLLSVAEVKELAALPSLEVSRAQLLGMFMQPAAGMARLLDAYAKKLGGGEGEAKPAAT